MHVSNIVAILLESAFYAKLGRFFVCAIGLFLCLFIRFSLLVTISCFIFFKCMYNNIYNRLDFSLDTFNDLLLVAT